MRNHTQPRLRSLHAKHAMTLVEMVVALAIFAVALGGMCTVVVKMKQASDVARDHYVAVNLAKNRIERAKTFGFDSLNTFVESDSVVDKHGVPGANARFRRTSSVRPVTTNLIEFAVTVHIRDRKTLEFDDEHEILTTYIADMQMGPPEEDE